MHLNSRHTDESDAFNYVFVSLSFKVIDRTIGPAYQELEKCLISLFQLVLDLCSSVQDIFTFAESMRYLNLDPEAISLC